jgi:hypothetical protein
MVLTETEMNVPTSLEPAPFSTAIVAPESMERPVTPATRLGFVIVGLLASSMLFAVYYGFMPF